MSKEKTPIEHLRKFIDTFFAPADDKSFTKEERKRAGEAEETFIDAAAELLWFIEKSSNSPADKEAAREAFFLAVVSCAVERGVRHDAIARLKADHKRIYNGVEPCE